MNLNIKKNNSIEEITDIVAFSINKQLQLGKKVLWFVTGGSSIPVQILIAKKITKTPESKLVITLTDERYSDNINYKESNWFKLKNSGFNIDGAKLIPVLFGKNIFETTKDFIKILESELNEADYKIGLFGVGTDGHTAGILPGTEAVNSEELACFYDASPFERITITFKTILKLDQAFVYTTGKDKWPIIDKLKEDLSVETQPSQILKKIPLLTIFINN